MHREKAFSLLELSVILIITAILIAGLTRSKSIIDQAKAKAFLVEIAKLRAFVSEFQASYNLALPGDINNATSYFIKCQSTNCNGNGNGYIGYADFDNNLEEAYIFWKHLEFAGLLDQTLSGTINSSAPYANVDNMYNSKAFDGAIYFPHFPFEIEAGQFYSTHTKNNNIFTLARPSHETIVPSGRVLSPGIAFNIDIKVDDGKPRAGRIKAYNYFSSKNGYHGTTAGNIAGTECDSLGHSYNNSDKVIAAAYYEVGLSLKECILLIDF